MTENLSIYILHLLNKVNNYKLYKLLCPKGDEKNMMLKEMNKQNSLK